MGGLGAFKICALRCGTTGTARGTVLVRPSGRISLSRQRFFDSAGRDGCALKSSPHQISYLLMAGKATNAASTRETMGANVVDPCTAVAGMLGADGRRFWYSRCRIKLVYYLFVW